MAASRICSVDGCDKPHNSRGYCKKHAARFLRYGDANTLQKVRGRTCSVDGCDKRHSFHGYCGAHAMRLKQHGDPLGGGTAWGETDRFFREVVLTYVGDECLFWPYNKNTQGYGQMQRDGRPKSVHRIVCEAEHGPPPTPKHEAAHSCGNGHLACVTKHHLSWKTHADNAADTVIHGTSLRGTKNPFAKLTEAQVVEIRALRGTMSQRRIAEEFGVAQSQISCVLSGRTWGWLSSDPKQ